jgi:hypothetical protein
MTQIADLTATQTLARIAAGTLSFAGVREALAQRIAEREPVVRAFVDIHPAPSAGPGPLAGTFFGVKDVLDTADQPSQYGNPIWDGWQPRADAAAVALAKTAGGAVMEGATKPDLKEFFSIGLDLAEDHPAVLAGEKLRGPNQWPAAVPELRPAMEAYFAAMARCGARLLEAVALSLDLPQNFFAPHYTLPLQRTQAIFYPPQPPDDHDGFGVAPHTDFGCITLLWQDDSGGLEVRERSTGVTPSAAAKPAHSSSSTATHPLNI